MLLALLLLLLDPTPNRPSLVVQIDRGDEECIDVDLPHLHEAVELALGWALEHRHAAPGMPGDTVVTIACVAEGDAAIELAIDDPQTGTIASRSFDAPSSSDPEQRAEVLALAVADLVRSTWHALEQEAPALLESNDQDHGSIRSRRRARNIARRPTAAWLAGDGFVVRSYFGERAPRIMLGEQVELVHRPLRNLAWKIDGELAAWRVPVGAGGALRTLSLGIAPALLGYGEFGGSSRPGRPGRVAIYAGAGARFGGVRMSSEAQSGKFRPLGGPLATARIEVVCGRFVRLALVTETGWLLAGPDDPQGLRMRGPWANGALVIVSAF